MIANEPESAKVFRKDADEWLTSSRFAVILAGLIVATFPLVIMGYKTFFYRDFGAFGYPLAQYQRDCFWRGELPLWNPLNDCGLPFLAQWNTLALYPPALFYLLFPLSWSLGIFNLGHVFLAGMGMYFLAHRWTGNRLAASVAGVVFAFNGLTWHSLMWPNDIAGLGWMPWVVLAVEWAWRRNAERGVRSAEWGSARGVILAGLAGAMQMLSGAPEIILLTWLMVGALWLGQFIAGRIPRGWMLARFTLVIILVAGLAAAQLLPFLDLLKHSHRDTDFGATAGWPMPLSGPANFLAPLFHCFAASQGVFVQVDQYWVPSYYLGAGLMALAVAGAWGVRKRRVWLLTAMAVLSVALALGSNGYLYSAVKAMLPQLGFIRYPIKFVVVAVLIIPLLAAYGVRWQREAAADSAREARTLRFIVSILWVLMAAIIWVAWRHPLVKDDWTATWRNTLVRAVFLLIVPGMVLWLGRARDFKWQITLRLGLLLALWLDVGTHAPNLSPTVRRSIYEPGLIRAELKMNPEPQGGESRFMETGSAEDRLHYFSVADPANDYICRRLAMFDNCNLLDATPKIYGFYSLYLRNTAQVEEMLRAYDAQNIDLRGLKDFLGIGHVNPSGPDGPKPLDWVSRDTCLPLVTMGQNPVFADATNTLLKLAGADFDPHQTVFLPLEARASITAKFTSTKINSQKITADNLTLDVDAITPAMLVMAQSFYHPWHAYIDGRPVHLWQANHAFQAVEVPAGAHQVKLIYEDGMFKLGAMISLLTTLTMATVWFWTRRLAE